MSTGDLHTLRSSTGDKKNRRRLKPSLPKFQIPLKAHRNARNRVVWSPELHERFVLALRVVEENQCRLFPKAILEVMNVSGLSRENIASHLQKYRLASSPFRPSTAALSRSAASLLSPMDVDADADFDADYDERSESTAASPTSLAEARDESTSGYDSGEEDAAEPAPAGTLAVPAAPMAMYAPPFVFTPPALSYLNTSSGSFPTAAHSVPHVTVPEGLCEPGDESPITSPREATQQGAQYPAKAVQYGVPVGYGMEEPKLFAEELELPPFAAEDEEKWFYVGHATLPQHGLEEVHDFDVGYI